MENNTEKRQEMTAQESLSLITETLNNSRNEITRRSGKYFLLWGVLLTFFSLLIYVLVKLTGREVWNWLWFGLPLGGMLIERVLRNREDPNGARNDVSRIVGGIWATYGIFACAVAAFTLLFTQLDLGPISTIVAMLSLTPELALLFGMAECVSGVALKNRLIRVAGYVTGLGSLLIYYLAGTGAEQILIFTFAGLVLVVTGLIVKHQYK